MGNSTNQTGDFSETISRNSTEPPLWRCRESNPGPTASFRVFYGRIHNVAFLTTQLLVARLGYAVTVTVGCPSRPRDRDDQQAL